MNSKKILFGSSGNLNRLRLLPKLINKSVTLAFASLGFIGTTHIYFSEANAEPDPVFKPILQDIRNQLPRGMVMRLPSVLNGYQNRGYNLYPEVNSRDSNENRLLVKLNTQPDCFAHACFAGYLSVYRFLEEFESSLISTSTSKRNQRNKICGILTRKNIALNSSVKAVSVDYDFCGADTGRRNYTIWKQDGYFFVVAVSSNNVDIATSMANEPPIYGSSSTLNTSAQACLTWDSYSSKLPPQGGRGGQWKAFKRLPPAFQNGCVLLENNNSLDIAYVLTAELNPDPYKSIPLNSFQNVPAFNSKLEKELDNLVKQGKALKVTWLTPTNGAIPYLRSIPHDRAFLREDGMTCFSTVCMMSGALSHRELSDILTISGQSQSSTPVKTTDTTTRYPTNVELTQLPVSAFADGEYELGDPTDTRSHPRRFKFRKVGNQITGIYVAAPSSMCIEGTINGNTIVGKGYQKFDSSFPTPQSAAPRFTRFKDSTLRSWDSSTSDFNLKVAKQVILYLPTDNQFLLWSKYRTVNLRLDGYQRHNFQRSSPLPKKCELKHYFTQKVLKESELQVFVP